MMKMAQSFILRPVDQGRAERKDVFNIYVREVALKPLHLQNGDLCQLEGLGGGTVMGRIAIARTDMRNNVIQVTQTFKEMHGLSFEGNYLLKRAETSVEQVKHIKVVEIPLEDGFWTGGQDEATFWEGFLTCHLSTSRWVASNMPLERLLTLKGKRSFKITEITTVSGRQAAIGGLCRFVETSGVTVDINRQHTREGGQLAIETLGIAGLERQLESLRKIVAGYNPSRSIRGRGLLLHGPSGTGKSLLLDKVTKAGWKKILRPTTQNVSSATAAKSIEQAFLEAQHHQPSLIVVDDLDRAQRSSGGEERLNSTTVCSLEEGFNTIKDSRVLVVGATRNVRDVPSSLRLPYRFEKEIDLPVPNTKARVEILSGLSTRTASLIVQREALDTVGDQTHGYNAADLALLWHTAVQNAESHSGINSSLPQRTDLDIRVSSADFESALREVRPSAMNEVFLDVPKVRWADVGGQQNVKEALQEAVLWPLKEADALDRAGVSPAKGMLLYGPPGCSKTLTAAAIANETGLNFLAVKGGEVLSMYVGESERKIREIFSKARAAQPSIIFFDEIETIGAERKESGSGVHTLTTLLNEMDGIEALSGVFILAATNQPWVLDSALIRPGRFDELIYVPLPDETTRREIFQLRLNKVTHDESVDVDWLAKNADGCSGAEITEICRKVSLVALRELKKADLPLKEVVICQRHFEKVLETQENGVSAETVTRFKEWSRGRAGLQTNL